MTKKICTDCNQALDLFKFTKRSDGSYRAKCSNCALGIKAGAIVFIDGDEPPAALVQVAAKVKVEVQPIKIMPTERRVIEKKIMAVSAKGKDFETTKIARTRPKKVKIIKEPCIKEKPVKIQHYDKSTHKRCPCCKVVLLYEDFQTSKNKATNEVVYTYCRPCNIKRVLENRKLRKSQLPPDKIKEKAPEGCKVCARCKDAKNLSEYSTRIVNGKSYPQAYCPPCALEKTKQARKLKTQIINV